MGKKPEDDLVVIINFCPESYPIYDIGVPKNGTWRLIFNSNADKYGGSGEDIVKKTKANEKEGFHNQPHKITIVLPGLSALIYKREPEKLVPAKTKIEKQKKIDSSKKPLAIKDDKPKPLTKTDPIKKK